MSKNSYEVNGVSQGLAWSEVPAPIYPAVSICGSGLSLVDPVDELISSIRAKNLPNATKTKGGVPAHQHDYDDYDAYVHYDD